MTATAQKSAALNGFARQLIVDGLLTEPQALDIQEQAQKTGVTFVTYVVQNQILDSYALAEAGANEFGVPLLDIEAVDIDPAVVGLVDSKLIRKHHALPLYKRGKRLFIGVSDPTNLEALDEIKFQSGLSTDPILIEEAKLARAIEGYLSGEDTVMQSLADVDLDLLEITGGDDDPGKDVSEAEVDDAPVVRFINKVLLDAIHKGASDIHFEPYERTYRVRYRHDGVLSEVASPPVNLAAKLSARIKVMARLDISERRMPQDGRIKMSLSKTRAIDFRVNTCPTLHGEKIVLRVLDSNAALLGVAALGFEEDQQQILLKTINKPQGMVLVTGPTGSGKTVTLYTALNILNTLDRNISTAEDPAEIVVPGINQVNVNPKVGLTFASVLRAFLRQDPDIIMVGEVRDLETAEIAIKAAQTGHMVFSTLHTNDGPQTLNRLMDMGVAPYNVASSVALIIAQRLARRLCPHCKKRVDVPLEALLKAGFDETTAQEAIIYQAVGCDQCNGGYKGRVGIYQVMPISEAMGRLIMEGCNSMALADQARKEGIADLHTSGLKKVRQGITSLEELHRVITD